MDNELTKALQYCFRYLGFRARSRHEVDLALQKKQFAKEIREQALDYCVQKKLLDDAAFADNLISYRQKGTVRGPLLVKQELQEKGIDPEIITESIEKCYTAEQEEEIVATLMVKKMSFGEPDEELITEKIVENKSKEKIFRYLLRKGFHYGVVDKVYSELQAEKLDNRA